MEPVIGRFAPTPSGALHVGNAFAFLLAWLGAKSQGGRIILRMEDLDPHRSSPAMAAQAMDDLAWLGLTWDEGGQGATPDPRYVQSQRTQIYQQYFDRLAAQGLVYPCFCSRSDLKAASAPHLSDGQLRYPGTCARLTPEQQAQRREVRSPAWRVRVAERSYTIEDGVQGRYTEYLPTQCGDFILRRSDGVFAYQLAVVVDDTLMGVNQVVRARDLLPSAPRQRYLMDMLGFPAPQYYHVPTLLDQDGKRLAKRERSIRIHDLRACTTPQALLGKLAFLAGLQSAPVPQTLPALLERFSWSRVPRQDIRVPEGLFTLSECSSD